MFSGRKERQALAAENAYLRGELERLGASDLLQVQQELAAVNAQVEQQRNQFESDRAAFAAECTAQQAQLSGLSADLVQTNDAIALQEAGVYQYRHVLADAEEYKHRLLDMSQQMTLMVKDKTAVEAAAGFTFNNSLAKGRKFVGDLSKLMLRAYNAEAENCVRVLKAGNLDSAIKRLERSVRVIERLGAMASIRVNPQYHFLRITELELTADYLAKKQEEKEAERDRKAQLREERQAMLEYERERDRLRKEQQHYRNAVESLRSKGDLAGAKQVETKLNDIDAALDGIAKRAANMRAGYVYVISNVGAFGPHVVKIGMTRRLDPMDRVRELGDASVPFRFDVHALFFSEDAVGIETQLHQRLADWRINKVNLRREFFQVTPAEVKELLHQMAGNLLDYTDTAEAPEYRQSIKGTAQEAVATSGNTPL